jgi:uncharacterized RDD family membrane protein YckC
VRDPTQVIWRRCLASGTSLLLIALVFLIAAYAGDVHTRRSGCPSPVPTGQSCVQRGSTGYLMKTTGFVWFALAFVLLLLAIVVLPQVKMGCSLGKAIFQIRVIRPDGRPPGLLRSLVRLVAWVIDGIALVLPVGLWLAIFTPGHRRVGDYLARTYVVERSAAGHPVPIPRRRPLLRHRQRPVD